jgi:hypothetical protein
MVELSNLPEFILLPAAQMAIAVTDSLNFHLITAKGHTRLHGLPSSLDASGFPTEAALTTDGPDGVGAIATGNEVDTFTDTRKVVLRLTSPFPLLHATALQKITIPLMPDPINSRFLRIYRVPQPTLEEGEVPSPLAHPTHQIRDQPHRPRDRLSRGSYVDLRWAIPPKKSRPARHHHIMECDKIIFATVALYAHGASLLGGSTKKTTPVGRSSYLARAIERLLRLHTSTRQQSYAPHEDSSVMSIDNTDAANTAERPRHVPTEIEQLPEHPIAMEEDTMPTDNPTEAPWHGVRSSKRRPQEGSETSLETMD